MRQPAQNEGPNAARSDGVLNRIRADFRPADAPPPAAGHVSEREVASASPNAAPAPLHPDLGSEYCAFARATADSESSPLLWPQLFTTFGVLQSVDIPSGRSTVLPERQRLLAGAAYNWSDITHGRALRRRAEAECARYQATQRLEAVLRALESNPNAPTPGALNAKSRVLEEALPVAREITTETKDAVYRYSANMDELNATQLRTEALFDLLEQTRQELQGLAGVDLSDGNSIGSLLRARQESEQKVEKEEERIRQSASWNISLRGGYDHVFSPQTIRPYFGTITLTFNPGWRFQKRADARALEARRSWALADPMGVDFRVSRLLLKLRAIQESEQARLRETNVLLTDLQGRMNSVQEISGRKAKAFADYLWFDLIKVRAEQEYLRTHIRELGLIVGPSERASAQ